ncbi:ATP-dependent permease [Paecilomyces lecythidis]
MAGLDIGQLDIQRLRSLIAVVPQQPALFPDTIAANIAYGLDSLSPFHTADNIRSAAKAVGIDDFISSLPEGYSTVVGDGGLSLSGGQTQLLTIARALVRQPRILVLDEVTSSLDAASAGIVRQTLRKLVAERSGLTVIIVSHSREMMDIADKIVVMEQGAIVEEGSYSGLMQREGGSLRRLVDDAKGN